MSRLVQRWIELWSEREPPALLAAIRMLVALVLLWDFAIIGLHDLAPWLWAPPSAGGLAPFDPMSPPLFYRVFPARPESARLLWLGLCASSLCLGIGLFTRSSAVAFVILYTQSALINPEADRAIDRAIRTVVVLLALSACGRVWSMDAKRQTGSFRGVAVPASAWPRYLILGQLVLLYCAAGLAKSGTTWYPWGGYNALYLILQDPIHAAWDFSWLSAGLPYFATRVGTALTHLWELGAPIVLVAAHYRRTRERPGRWRRLFNRLPVRNVYVLIGVVFHLTLAATLRLGIFPFAMLAFFPAFFRPQELMQRLPESWRPRAET